MKVKDIMQKDVVYVSPKTPLKEVAKLIFGHGINGLPVCRNKKLVGMITEKDILSQFLPTVQDYIEDPVHARDFEGMEKKVAEILGITDEKIMSKNPITVSEDTPLLEAQSLMFVHKIGRLPVVDDKGELIGILSKGDIFRAIVGRKLPFEEEEGFYDWIARHYDLIINWGKRLPKEIPELIKLFKKEKLKKILDVGSGTGEHSIAIAQKRFEVTGVDKSSLMHQISEAKKEKKSKEIKEKLTFINGNYGEILRTLKGFDIALFLGNFLPHVLLEDKNILKETAEALNPKSFIVIQVINFEKIFKSGNGLRLFSVRKSNLAYEEEHAFLGFYTKKEKITSYTFAIFDSNQNWSLKDINSTHIYDIRQNELIKMLKDVGFSSIYSYGSSFDSPMFGEPFKPLESDWLNIVAKRDK